MHELSITHSIVEICENAAAGRRVIEVVLEIGTLSNVVPDAIEFCFEACTKETLLDGARLTIDRIAGQGRCRECAAQFKVSAYFDKCPACGACRIEILSGEELRVKKLEVE